MGTLVSVGDDSMLVRGTSDTDTTLVRLSQVTQLDVSHGPGRRHVVRNAAIGAVVGTGVGWQIGRGRVSGGCRKGDYCWENPFEFYYNGGQLAPITDKGGIGAVVGGLLGGSLGALVSLRPAPAWQRVPLARRSVTVSVTPWGGSLALAF